MWNVTRYSPSPFPTDSGHAVLAHQVVERGNVGGLDLLPLRQLRCQPRVQFVVDLELLRGGSLVEALNKVVEAGVLLIEHVGIAQVAFRTLHLDLHEHLFHRGHLGVEGVGGSDNFAVRLALLACLVFQAGAHASNLIDSAVQIINVGLNLLQFGLLLQVDGRADDALEARVVDVRATQTASCL